MNPTIMAMAYKSIILLYSEKTGKNLRDSTLIFYNSKVYELMQSGEANYYCMSPYYLCEDLINERRNKTIKLDI